MVLPCLLVVVETGTRAEVEPRFLHLVPVGLDLGSIEAGLDPRDVVGVVEEAGESGVHHLLGNHLQLFIRPEQIDLDAGHHLGDAEIGDRWEGLLAEPEEVEIGGVAEIEELEVVLPDPQDQILEAVVVGLQAGSGPRTETVGDDRQILHLR